MTHIWLVDDDPLLLKDLVPCLENELGVEVKVFQTEAVFRSCFQEVAVSSPPSVVVLDVMLMWTMPGPQIISRAEGCSDSQKAGFRCRDLLKSFASTRRVPVVFYTFLSSGDCDRLSHPDPVITKRAEHHELLAKIRRMLGEPAVQNAYRV